MHYQANRETRIAYQEAYRANNLEKVTAYRAAYRVANPEKYRGKREVYAAANPERELWAAARKRAGVRGLPFDIEISDIVIPEFCPALGIRLERRVGQGKGASGRSPSLDRLDPKRGYVKGNVAVISFRANAIKRDATPSELMSLAQWVASAGGSK